MVRHDHQGIHSRELSVMFIKDLHVVGLGAAASYQTTFGSVFNPMVILRSFGCCAIRPCAAAPSLHRLLFAHALKLTTIRCTRPVFNPMAILEKIRMLCHHCHDAIRPLHDILTVLTFVSRASEWASG